MPATDSSTLVNTSLELGRPRPLVQRFIIRLQSGLFLHDYTPNGVIETARAERARVFFSKRSAEGNSRILHGRVIPAPSTPVDAPRPRPISFPPPPQPPARPQPPALIVDVSAADLLLYETMIELGGGRLRGVQKGDGKIGLSALILFDDATKAHQSTLCLRPEDVSSRRVRQELRKKLAEFEKYQDKAADRIFRQFSQVGA